MQTVVWECYLDGGLTSPSSICGALSTMYTKEHQKKIISKIFLYSWEFSKPKKLKLKFPSELKVKNIVAI